MFGKTTTVAKFSNPKQVKQAVFQYMKGLQQKENQETKQQHVAQAFVEQMRQVQSDGGSVMFDTDDSKEQRNELDKRVKNIIQTSSDDVERLKKLNELILEVFNKSEESQDRLIKVIEGAYLNNEGAVVVNNGEKPVDDLQR